ncbi:hypothetical protein SAMN04489812_4823 [Microlunatus soli]|uniref:Uncharacterized protein n=2 Tax=Microlunatus soli TaxID=630515 RepID=A0A1H1YWK0_9ACTN|nr:hypothetical protein SAMN04489812_4823 [Microlunatus soli]
MCMPMRQSTSGATCTSAALAATGASAGVVHILWLAVALMILGGCVLTAAKLAPRVAVEPVRRPDGHYRLRLTWNGRPVGRRD